MYLVKILRFFFVGGFILMLGMSIWITEDGKEDWLASQPVNYEKIEGVVESYWESHETVGLTSTPSAYFYLNNGNIYFCQNVAFLKTKNYKKQQAIGTKSFPQKAKK